MPISTSTRDMRSLNSHSQPSPPAVRAPILVVDDDEALCETLVMQLDIEGYRASRVTSTTEALTYLRVASRCHMVLLDYTLWGGNAEPLLYAGEGDVRIGRHRYALMSGRTLSQFSAETTRLITARCTGFLRKPFDVERLLEEVEWAAAHLPAPL